MYYNQCAGSERPGQGAGGGTDLLIQMRSGRLEPELLVDVERIAEMTAVVAENGGFRFGAAVSCMQLIEHEAFAKAWLGVTDAVKLIASIQGKGKN